MTDKLTRESIVEIGKNMLKDKEVESVFMRVTFKDDSEIKSNHHSPRPSPFPEQP